MKVSTSRGAHTARRCCARIGLRLAVAPPLAFADIHRVAASRTIDPATLFRLSRSLIITFEGPFAARRPPTTS